MTPSIDPHSPPPVWLIAILAAVTATGPLSMQMFLPALPEVQRLFAVDPAVAQLTISVSMIAVAISTLVYGPVSDRFGRKPVLAAGLAIFLLGSVACALAPDIETLIVGRIVQGAGGAAGLVLARAVARDLYGPSQAAGVIARLTIIMVIAPMVAPAIGGIVNDVFQWRAIFVVISLAAVVIIVASLRLPESHQERGSNETPADVMRGFGMLLSSPRFCVLAMFPAFSSMVFFSFISGAPYVMVTLLGRPATEYGLYFMGVVAGFMLGNFLTIRLGSRIPLMRMMTIGAYVMVAAVGILAACIGAGLLNPLTLFVPTALAQVGQGLALPNAQAAVINLVPHRAGTASSVTGFLQMVAAAIASQLVGTLQNGTAWPLVLMMGAGALGALTVMGIARTMLGRKDRS